MRGVILCSFGIVAILFGLSLPVLDDLCGPTAAKELQNTVPLRFWSCVAIPVLFGVFLLFRGYTRCCKATKKSPIQ